jgi:ketosteroid isomerase-like protein
MTNRTHLLILAATAALLPGCDRATHERSAETEQVDTAAEESAIRDANQRWLQLIRDKDGPAIAQLYAEDGVLMPPGESAVRGRAAIGEWWGRSTQMPGYELSFATDRLVFSESGDMALDTGTWSFRASPASGPIEDNGKYVVVWRKVGNDWKVAADIFNSDNPPAGG